MGLDTSQNAAADGDRAAVPGVSAAERFLHQLFGRPLDGTLSQADKRHLNFIGLDLSVAAVTHLHSAISGPKPWWNSARSKLNLVEADLAGMNLRSANLEGCDLTRANLVGTSLGNAKLSGISLEGALLRKADLAGADLRGAELGGADLRSALLEGANLSDATLRFANLSGAVLERTTLQRADLWGTTLDEAILVDADLSGATLQEASLQRADLTKARLNDVNAAMTRMHGAVLSNADLRGGTFQGAELDDAVMQGCKLQEVDLSSCTLARVHLAGAWLAGTRLEREQLANALGEEITHEHGSARRGYLALEQSFSLSGDTDSASWAYKKRRRMQKLEERDKARSAFRARNMMQAASYAARYIADLSAELLCDYGESIPRVLMAMTIVYLSFCLIYGLSGNLIRTGPTGAGSIVTLSDTLDLAVFSLLAMTTSGSPAVGLLPRTEAVHLLTGLEALCGIFLTGLLGFVVGNRIRR